jgi:hypothetical protein
MTTYLGIYANILVVFAAADVAVGDSGCVDGYVAGGEAKGYAREVGGCV